MVTFWQVLILNSVAASNMERGSVSKMLKITIILGVLQIILSKKGGTRLRKFEESIDKVSQFFVGKFLTLCQKIRSLSEIWDNFGSFPVSPNLLRKNYPPLLPQTITSTKNFIIFLNDFLCHESC